MKPAICEAGYLCEAFFVKPAKTRFHLCEAGYLQFPKPAICKAVFVKPAICEASYDLRSRGSNPICEAGVTICEASYDL